MDSKIGNQYQAIKAISPFEKGELFSITNEGKGDFVVRTTHVVEFGKIVREKDVSRHIKKSYFYKLEWNDSIRKYKAKKLACEHPQTEELDHPYLPTIIVCLSCKKTINGSLVGNTTITEFENE